MNYYGIDTSKSAATASMESNPDRGPVSTTSLQSTLERARKDINKALDDVAASIDQHDANTTAEANNAELAKKSNLKTLKAELKAREKRLSARERDLKVREDAVDARMQALEDGNESADSEATFHDKPVSPQKYQIGHQPISHQHKSNSEQRVTLSEFLSESVGPQPEAQGDNAPYRSSDENRRLSKHVTFLEPASTNTGPPSSTTSSSPTPTIKPNTSRPGHRRSRTVVGNSLTPFSSNATVNQSMPVTKGSETTGFARWSQEMNPAVSAGSRVGNGPLGDRIVKETQWDDGSGNFMQRPPSAMVAAHAISYYRSLPASHFGANLQSVSQQPLSQRAYSDFSVSICLAGRRRGDREHYVTASMAACDNCANSGVICFQRTGVSPVWVAKPLQASERVGVDDVGSLAYWVRL